MCLASCRSTIPRGHPTTLTTRHGDPQVMWSLLSFTISQDIPEWRLWNSLKVHVECTIKNCLEGWIIFKHISTFPSLPGSIRTSVARSIFRAHRATASRKTGTPLAPSQKSPNGTCKGMGVGDQMPSEFIWFWGWSFLVICSNRLSF